MRELKFRVWDGKNILTETHNGPIADSEYININDLISFYKIKGFALMQFTGLLDKNGKEIYEGDIITTDKYPFISDGKPNYNATVEWIYSQWQYILHAVNPDISGISDGINSGLNDYGHEDGQRIGYEVIGNIYENPELLK